MSSAFHLSMVGFTVSHIVQHHYILWSAPFQIVNPKVNNFYINPEFQNILKKSGLHLAALTFGHLKAPPCPIDFLIFH